MLLGHLVASNVALLCLVVSVQVLCWLPPLLLSDWRHNVTGVLEHLSGHLECCDAAGQDASNRATSLSDGQVWKYNRISSFLDSRVVGVWLSLHTHGVTRFCWLVIDG